MNNYFGGGLLVITEKMEVRLQKRLIQTCFAHRNIGVEGSKAEYRRLIQLMIRQVRGNGRR